MVVLHLDVNELFISAPNHQEEIRAWKIDSLHAYKLRVPNWKSACVINIPEDELEVFGVVLRGQALRDLTYDLWHSWLTVNRQGLCLIYTGVLSNASNRPLVLFGSEFYRLNDFFGWSKYGVAIPSTSMICWNKVDMHSYRVLMNAIEDQEKLRNHESKLKQKEMELLDYKRLLDEKEMEMKLCKLRLKEDEEKVKEKDKELREVSELFLSEQMRIVAVKGCGELFGHFCETDMNTANPLERDCYE